MAFLRSIDDIEDSDKKLVHGYFLAERLLHDIESDVTVLDDCEEFRGILDAETYCIEDEEWE